MKFVIFVKNLIAFVILESILIISLKNSESFQVNLRNLDTDMFSELKFSKKKNRTKRLKAKKEIYNSTERKLKKKKILNRENEFILRDINKNFSFSSNQTEILKKADLLSSNESHWGREFTHKEIKGKFFPYQGINLTSYKTLMSQAKSNSISKISQPFNSILNRIKNLYGPSIQKNMLKEVERIRNMTIDDATEEIIRFGEIIKASKKNEKIYWYYFFIVSRVILNGRLIHNKENNTYITRKWDISENSFNRKRKLNLTEQKISNNFESKSEFRILALGEDKNYDDLVLKDQKYSDVLKFYKMLSMNQILKTDLSSKIDKIVNITKKKENQTDELSHLNYLQNKNSKINRNKIYFLNIVKSYNSSQTLRLTDLRVNILLVEKLKKTFLFQELSKFPKGVIHHLHWSAAFFLGDILAGVEKLIDENYNKKLITVIIKGNVYTPSKVRVNQFREIRSPKLLIIEDFIGFLEKFYSGKYKKDIENFKHNYILADERCISDPMYPVNQANKINPSVKAYMIFKHCRGSIIYSKVSLSNSTFNLSFLDKARVKEFHVLSEYLQNFSHVLNGRSNLIKNYLSKTYLNMLHTNKDRESVAVWTKFENIFGIYTDLFDNTSVFKYLNEMLLGSLLNDKVIGVEFRQKYDIGKPDSRMEILKNMKYEKRVQHDASNRTNDKFEIKRFPVSFILPGRKVTENHKLADLLKGLLKAKKKNDESTVGFDFFGYEDDPFSGARNFFPLTLRKFGQESKEPIIHKMEHVFFNPPKPKSEEKLKVNDFEIFLNMLRDGHKLYLHAGETVYFPDYPVNAKFLKKFYVNDNLIHSALLPNVMRLGHGFAAGSNDLLMNIYRRKNISLEICPVSNQALKYSSVAQNPLRRLLREGISVTISPDDPGLFFYSRVRMDWLNLIMQTDLLPSEYYILLRNSILKSSINKIKNNAQKFLDETKMQMEEFFNSENYRIMREAFPDNKEVEKYLTLEKQKGVKFDGEQPIKPLIKVNPENNQNKNNKNIKKKKKKNKKKNIKKNENKMKNNNSKPTYNPELNIYNFESITQEYKNMTSSIGNLNIKTNMNNKK